MSEKSLVEIFRAEPGLTQSNLQIIACAGAGKTEFISTRIAYLVAEKLAAPENIVAFTFTERAAEELKFRIRSKIRQFIGCQPDIGDLFVGTIHGFSFELLKEFQPGFRGFDVLDEGKRYAFLGTISGELGYEDLRSALEVLHERKPYGVTNQAWVFSAFLRSMDIIREEMLTAEQVTNCQAFTTAMQIYDEKLHERRFLDFSSMMALAVQMLDDESLLTEVRQRYTYITVDEYQDVNPIQEKLIQLLAGDSGNLCVVGDDDQSIYQWRGSTTDNILTFHQRYPDVHVHHLPTNYRSTDKVIGLSNQLIKKNHDRLPKSMQSTEKTSEPGDIYKLKFDLQKDEAEFVVNRIQNLVGMEWVEKDDRKRGLAYSDIALLFRSVKYDSRAYLDALDEAKIPYVVSGTGGLFEAPEVDVVFDILSYLGDFPKIWNWEEGEGTVPGASNIYNEAKKYFVLPQINAFLSSLEHLKQHVEQQRRISLQGLYAQILTLLGLTNGELHDDLHELQMYNLGQLSQAISDYEGTRTYSTPKDIKRFCWFITHYARSAYDSGAGDDPTRVLNAVQVMTLHATKGLGFPVVFMPFCVEKQPRKAETGFLDPEKFDFSRYNGSEEDERRLFYVGMTRAKKFLYVTTSRDPGYRKRKKTPSTFLHELDDQFCLTEAIPDPTNRNKLKPQPAADDFRFPTNYSELSDYIRCEYDYKLRYIYGFNPIIVQALGYGRQVHNILNILHKLTQTSNRIPTENEVAEVLLTQFYLRYAAQEQGEILKKSALRSILRYLEMWREDFSLSVKSERSFEMDMDNALITGTIDLLKRRNAIGNILEIIDFKTGNERRSMDELHLQVQLYTIAAREALNLAVEKAFIHFLDEKKQNRLEVLTTPTQLDWATRSVRDAIHGITDRRFNRNPRNVGVCEQCDWEKICPKGNGN